jgi:hypothetical protein
MKIPTTIFVCFFCCSYAAAQVPEDIAGTRWILTGEPRITSMVSTASGKVTKTVWFSAYDSSEIGTMNVPSKCVPGTVTLYRTPAAAPTVVAYAEKAFSVQDTAKKKPAKYKPQVWWLSSYLRDSVHVVGSPYLFAMTPPPKKGEEPAALRYQMPLAGEVAAFSVGRPYTLQWAQASKHYPAALWFLGSDSTQFPSTKVFSFSPQKKPTVPYGCEVTQFVTNQLENFSALHVEDGLIWTLGSELGGNPILTVVPAGGNGIGLQWSLPANPDPSVPATITPVYITRKPGEGVLPDQVWVTGFVGVVVLSLSSSTSSAVQDTMWFNNDVTPYPFKFNNGFFADNASKGAAGKDVAMFTETPPVAGPGWTVDLSFVQVKGGQSMVSRTAVSVTASSEVVSAVVLPSLPMTEKTVAPSCISGTPTSNPMPSYIPTEYDFSYTGLYYDFSAPFFAYISSTGYIDTKKFDLVFTQMGSGGASAGTSSDPTISRLTGKFSTPPKSASQFASQPGGVLEQPLLANPKSFSLTDAYPNPFNPTTTVRFTLPENALVTLRVYNMLGQEVESLIDRKPLGGGEHEVQFNASRLASGVYFYRIDAGRYTATKKLMLVK